jgi:hypothetical protein
MIELGGRLKSMPPKIDIALSCATRDHTWSAVVKPIVLARRFIVDLDGILAEKCLLRDLGGPFSEVLGEREQTDLHFGLGDGP